MENKYYTYHLLGSWTVHKLWHNQLLCVHKTLRGVSLWIVLNVGHIIFIFRLWICSAWPLWAKLVSVGSLQKKKTGQQWIAGLNWVILHTLHSQSSAQLPKPSTLLHPSKRDVSSVESHPLWPFWWHMGKFIRDWKASKNIVPSLDLCWASVSYKVQLGPLVDENKHYTIMWGHSVQTTYQWRKGSECCC